ncbi:MAG: hypothetical protein ACLP9L_30150 [Thermoguttaceae bacterium]
MVSASAPDPRPHWHKAFMAFLPQITTFAKCAFAFLRPEGCAEAVQEVVANACQAYARLVELGKTDFAYPIALARYGVRQTRDHRKVGGHLNVRDVLSRYCQTRKDVVVERLDKFDHAENGWEEVLIEDRHAGPADTTRVRLDFSAWFASLKRRDRRVAEFLANGETTKAAARKFKVSAGRISQLRKELAENWRKFIGDQPGPALAA